MKTFFSCEGSTATRGKAYRSETGQAKEEDHERRVGWGGRSPQGGITWKWRLTIGMGVPLQHHYPPSLRQALHQTLYSCVACILSSNIIHMRSCKRVSTGDPWLIAIYSASTHAGTEDEYSLCGLVVQLHLPLTLKLTCVRDCHALPEWKRKRCGDLVRSGVTECDAYVKWGEISRRRVDYMPICYKGRRQESKRTKRSSSSCFLSPLRERSPLSSASERAFLPRPGYLI